jgi:hypothetical protein
MVYGMLICPIMSKKLNSSMSRALWGAALLAITVITLAIAIPHFTHAQPAAQPVRAAKVAHAPAVKADSSWKEYTVAGVQVVSPVTLTKKDAVSASSSQPVELYIGQVSPSTLSVALTRRELGANEDCALEKVASMASDKAQQEFPEGFVSGSHEVDVHGIPARRLVMQFVTGGTPVQSTSVIFVKQPYIWEVKVEGPKTLSGLNADTERVLNSIQLTGDALARVGRTE